MRVRQGWSGEVEPNQWAKFALELEEEDLRRLLTVAGIPTDLPLSTTVAFQLLEVEAEYLVMAKLIGRYGYPGDKGAARLGELSAAKQKLLDILRAQTKASTP